jgi:hypothetical protein
MREFGFREESDVGCESVNNVLRVAFACVYSPHVVSEEPQVGVGRGYVPVRVSIGYCSRGCIGRGLARGGRLGGRGTWRHRVPSEQFQNGGGARGRVRLGRNTPCGRGVYLPGYVCVGAWPRGMWCGHRGWVLGAGCWFGRSGLSRRRVRGRVGGRWRVVVDDDRVLKGGRVRAERRRLDVVRVGAQTGVGPGAHVVRGGQVR